MDASRSVTKKQGAWYYAFLIVCAWFISGCGEISLTPPDAPVSAQNPKDPYYHAQQALEAGRLQEAINWWEQILPSDPNYMDAQLAIATARRQIEGVQQTETAEFNALSEFETYLQQAEALEQQGHMREALQLYERAQALEPQNLSLQQKIQDLFSLFEDESERHKRLGELYLAQAEYQKARQEWEALLKADPSNNLAKQRLADIEALTTTSDKVFVQRGRSLLKKGLIHQAQAEFEKARRVNPTNQQTQAYLAQLSAIPFTEYTVSKGDTLSSIAQKYSNDGVDYLIIADFNQLPADAPLKIGHRLKIPHTSGLKQTVAPEVADAPSEITVVADTDAPASRAPEKTDATRALEQQMFDQGLEAYQHGNYREAINLFNQVYEKDPENQEAYEYFMRAMLNIQQGTTTSPEPQPQPNQPTPPAERSAPAETELDTLLRTAQAHREAGKLNDALAGFEQAAQLARGNPAIAQQIVATREELEKAISTHLNEGIRYFNREALEEAIAEWQKVLALDPTHQQALNYKKQAEKRLEALSATPTPEPIEGILSR